MLGHAPGSKSAEFSPRAVFGIPGNALPALAPAPPPTPGELAKATLGYYREPFSWVVLLVTSAMLCYVGGGAMFWYHAEYLGEGGPAISWQYHWLLDSTFAFVVLTPALAVLLPLATWLTATTVGRLRPAAVPAGFAALLGVAFAVLTTPGPLAHNLLVGRGTWVADQVTAWVGDPSAPASPHQHHGVLAALTQQLGFGLPLYVSLACLTVVLLRSMASARWRLPSRG